MLLLGGCGGGASADATHNGGGKGGNRIPGVGATMRSRIPANARQVVAVYGESTTSADSTIALFSRHGDTWTRERTWPGHNGKRGWTTDHHGGDNKSPVGVFTLTDAGGVLADPGSKLPYHRSAGFKAPRSWAKSHWHDFDLVVAINYNRVKGTSPLDPTRPQGQSKGGSIWLHMDHGSGTSACVGQSKADMEYLLRTLDPAAHPVVVMGDIADLEG
jgi:L,D-peptidoglycan transpeptidase YkuD (ErfK/YbiS/YcfS/YnhG family)